MQLHLFNQRWRDRRESYRPREPIQTRLYEVAFISGDREAKDFVLRHHFSGTYPAARFRYGLYRGQQLVGVAVFSHPCNDRVLTSVFPAPAIEAVELGRFVLLDEVPGNGETWFLGRCFELLRRQSIVGVVSFSDPVARTDAAGNVVHPGHIGTIYQAHNAVYLGRGTPRTLKLLPDGSVLSDRSLQKLRTGERGWRYTLDRLRSFGADWDSLIRPLRHAGNHKYAWGLTRQMRRALPRSGAYPKRGFQDAA